MIETIKTIMCLGFGISFILLSFISVTQINQMDDTIKHQNNTIQVLTLQHGFDDTQIKSLKKDITILNYEIKQLENDKDWIENSCNSWKYYNQTPQTLLGGFATDEGYWVYTKDRKMMKVVSAETHEQCHSLIFDIQGYKHFCQYGGYKW